MDTVVCLTPAEWVTVAGRFEGYRTRPLGLTICDLLDRPINHGGLDLSCALASALIAICNIGCILHLPQGAGFILWQSA